MAGSFTESLVHHYLLPEQLVRVLDEQGFVIDDIFGDFEETSFSPDESEHLVVVARRRESAVAQQAGIAPAPVVCVRKLLRSFLLSPRLNRRGEVAPDAAL